MVQIISSGRKWLGRQCADAFAKVEFVDCAPEGLTTVEFAGHEFHLSVGVWYLYHTTDAYGARNPHYWTATEQPSFKWEEALHAQKARQAFDGAYQKARQAGTSEEKARDSARRRVAKLGFDESRVVYPASEDIERAKKAAEALERRVKLDLDLAEFRRVVARQPEAVRKLVADAFAAHPELEKVPGWPQQFCHLISPGEVKSLPANTVDRYQWSWTVDGVETSADQVETLTWHNPYSDRDYVSGVRLAAGSAALLWDDRPEGRRVYLLVVCPE